MLPPMLALQFAEAAFDVETDGILVPIVALLLLLVLLLALLLLPLFDCAKNRYRRTAAFDIVLEFTFASETILEPAGIVSFGFI